LFPTPDSSANGLDAAECYVETLTLTSAHQDRDEKPRSNFSGGPDAGLGFDPELRNENAGLGLVSMRERLRLVGGRLSVQSAPMRGTEILAEVPLSVSADEPRVKLMTAGGTKS
jgi:signal transduction histidine kinase